MSLHFHILRINNIVTETADCVSVIFDVPAELKESFQFKQGQSLTMRTTIDGKEVRRTYSICASPAENELKVAIKKVAGGLFSFFANEKLKAGDTLEVMEPVGKFYTELNASNKKNYLAFAAGSGITPIISIIKTTLETESQSRFTLVYGNKNRMSIIFFEELEGLKNKYIDRFNLVNILSRERTDSTLNSGKINSAKLDELNKLIDYSLVDQTFICGPEEMLFCIKNYLEASGCDKKKIHFELFTTAGQKNKQKIVDTIDAETGAKSSISLKADGRFYDFTIPFNSELSILDAAMQEGADLPYACKGGMCCTCKAKLIEGEVIMDVHWGLEEEEVENGYILTCQSHPKTEKVVVDFDAK